MADSRNNSVLLRTYSQKGTRVDLKAKLKKAEVADGVMTEWAKWLTGWKKTTALIFDEVEEGGPLHLCGIRNGDELTSVNLANVDCSLDVNHIASVFRDCLPTVILGIKRRRVIGSVPIVTIFQLSDADTNPAFRFCGFYWGIFLKDISKILDFCNLGIEPMYRFSSTQENVEVIAEEGNQQYLLTFNNGKLTFQPRSYDPPDISNLWVIHVYTYTPCIVPAFTPIVFVPQHDQSRAINVTDDQIRASSLLVTPTRGMFFKAFGITSVLYHMESLETSSFLGASTDPNTQIPQPSLSSDPTAIRLQQV